MKPTSTPHSPRWTLRLLALLALLLPPAAHAQFTYVTNGGTLTITRYTGNASTVAVPSHINGRRVTRIGTKAFYSKYYLTRVSLSPTLTRIDAKAFMNCFNLASISIPDSVTHLGSFAFMACGHLASARISTGIDNIAIGTFDSCRDLKSITLPPGLTNLDAYAFSYCESLSQVSIPNSVRSIGPWAFYACTRLTSVLVGQQVGTIDRDAFRNCPRLADVCFQGDTPWLWYSKIFDQSPKARVCYLPWRQGWGVAFSDRPTRPRDLYEPDNTRSTARTLARNQTQFHCIHAVGDQDWVKFTVPAAGARHVRLDTAGTSGDLEMWLYKGNGQLVKYDDNSGPGRFPRISLAALPPGTYYLRLREFGNNARLSFFSLRATWSSP